MDRAETPVYAAVGLLSATALGLEVLLLRLFSLAHWPFVAHMVISIALLGIGVSGVVIAFWREWLLRNFAQVLPVCGLLLGVAGPVCTSLALKLPLTPEALVWDPLQPALLGASYLLLAIPFLFAATAIGLALIRSGDRPGPIYAADLFGAGLGSVAILALLDSVPPGRALALVGASGLVAGAIGWFGLNDRSRHGASVFVVFAAVVALAPEPLLRPNPSEYKPLTQYLRIPGAIVVAERTGAEGVVTAVANESVPLRYAPGMSFVGGREPPSQTAVFLDADSLQAVDAVPDPASLAYLDASAASLPYRLRPPESVLVVSAGSGTEVNRALRSGARRIDALEPSAEILRLIRDDLRAPPLADRGKSVVSVFVTDARHLPNANMGGYDLVVYALPPQTSGQHPMTPAFELTVEALLMLGDRLSGSGILAINLWIDLPARRALRLLSTVAETLRRRGIADPASHIALLRGWQTAVILMSKRPFSPEQIARVRTSMQELALDGVHFPGIDAAETNRYNRLSTDWFREGASALLGPHPDRFIRSYKFHLEPITDARPYLYHDTRWSTLFEGLDLRESGGLALVPPGLLVLVATLVQASVLAALLVLLPMALTSGKTPALAGDPPRIATTIYFSAIGLGFMFFEIAAIQRATLLIGRPTYSAAVVIAGFLLFAGMGALASRRLAQVSAPYPLTGIAVVIAVVGGLIPVGSQLALGLIESWPLWGRIMATLALNAPLAFLLGFPFPAGLATLAVNAPELRPWAWGVNGCASVIGAILAAIVALQIGLDGVTLLAMVLYPVAAAVRLDRQPAR